LIGSTFVKKSLGTRFSVLTKKFCRSFTRLV